MRQLRNRLLWQVVISIVALTLITHAVDGTKGRKNKCSKNKKCAKCLQVQVNKPVIALGDASGIRSFAKRSIVSFEYKNIRNPGGYPEQIVEVVCSDRCLGNVMNVAPIKRNMIYLKRDGNVLVLEEMVVTVGCTCVTPEVKEQHSR